MTISRRRLLKQGLGGLAAASLPLWSYAEEGSQALQPGWERKFGVAPSGKPSGRILTAFGEESLASRLAHAGAEQMQKFYTPIEYQHVSMPGDNTIRATLNAKYAPADGTTILEVHSPTFNSFPALYRELPYVQADFKPLAIMAEYTLFFTVGPVVDDSVETIDDYIDWVRDNPEYASMGFTQYGSPGHFAQLIFARAKQPAIRPQPYRETAMMVDDMLDGVLAAGMVIGGTRLDLYENDTLRVLATTSRTRYGDWDHVPTCREQGIDDMDVGGWYGWFVHQQLPDAIYSELKTAVEFTVSARDYSKLLSANALQPSYDTDFELFFRLEEEAEKYRALAQSFRLGKV